MLGLSTGPVCLAYCAPILVPLIVAEDEQHKFFRTFRLLGLFLLGRLGGYIGVGLVTGILGSSILKFSKGTPQAVVSLLMGMILLAFGLMKNFPRLKLCEMLPKGRSSVGWGVVLGFLTGLSICPPFIAAVTVSAALGSLQGSLFYFIAFFVGTAIYIPPMVFLGPLSRVTSVNQVAKICLILTGSWFTIKGLAILLG